MGNHLYTHLRVYNGLQDMMVSPDGPIFTMQRLFFMSQDYTARNLQFYPPLFFFTSAFINAAFHTTSLLITRLANMPYFVLLIIAVYLIGRIIFGAAYGLLAAVLISLYPSIAGMSRLYTLDFPLACVTVFAVYCLIKTDYFTRLKESSIFAVALGIGILIKAQILFFLIAPCLYAMVKSIWENRKNKRKISLIFGNAFIALFIAMLVSSVWWLPVMKSILQKFYVQASVMYSAKSPPGWIGGLMDLRPFSRDWLLSYVYFSLNNFSPVLFFLFIAGLVCFLRIKFKHKGIIIAWLLASYLLLTFFPVKKDRFFMPAHASMALISVALFYAIKNGKVKKILIVTFIGFALFQFFFLSYFSSNKDFNQRNSIFHLVTPMDTPKMYGASGPKLNFYECICSYPFKSNIKQVSLSLIKYTAETSAIRKEKNIGILVHRATQGHEDFSLMYILKSNNQSIKFYSLSEKFHSPFAERGDTNKPPLYDYVIIVIDDKSLGLSDNITLEQIRGANGHMALEHQDSYFPVDSWRLRPDNARVFLFKRKVIQE